MKEKTTITQGRMRSKYMYMMIKVDLHSSLYAIFHSTVEQKREIYTCNDVRTTGHKVLWPIQHVHTDTVIQYMVSTCMYVCVVYSVYSTSIPGAHEGNFPSWAPAESCLYICTCSTYVHCTVYTGACTHVLC